MRGDVRVLLLEDHADLRAVIAEMLADEGYAVRPCASVGDLLEEAGDDGACVALVDPWFDGLTSLATHERAELLALARSTPTILMTDRTWARPELAHELGLLDLLAKPFDLDQLLEALERACRTAGRLPSDRGAADGPARLRRVPLLRQRGARPSGQPTAPGGRRGTGPDPPDALGLLQGGPNPTPADGARVPRPGSMIAGTTEMRERYQEAQERGGSWGAFPPRAARLGQGLRDQDSNLEPTG